MKERSDPKKWLIFVFATSVVALMLYGATSIELSTSEDVNIPADPGISANRLGSTQSEKAKERVIFNEEPPYLLELPILDSNLYVKHDNNAFLIGGTNLQLIRYSAWKRSGGKATSIDREGFIEFVMSEQPYIEFSYKEKFYSVEVISRLYSYRFVLRELPEPTIELNNAFRE